MKQDDKQAAIILSVIGIIPVVWLALLIAPSVGGGLPEILPKLMTVFNNPFHMQYKILIYVGMKYNLRLML